MKTFLRMSLKSFAPVVLLVTSCSVNRNPARCVDDTTIECICDSDRSGSRTCSSGTFSDCACPSRDETAVSSDTIGGPDAGDSIDANDSSIEAGSRDSGKPSQSPSDAGQTGKAGKDASRAPIEAGSRDSGKPSESPSDAGQPLEPEKTNTDSGTPDTNRDSGEDGSETNPDPSGVYGQCADDTCSGEQECVTVYDGTGTYCSVACEDDEQCPDALDGDAIARCSSLDGMCRLKCESDAECPAGMECFGDDNERYTCVWP
jgi:hypothetical protein